MYSISSHWENCLSPRRIYAILFARLLRTGMLQRDSVWVYMHRTTSKSTNLVAETTWLQPLCFVPFLLFFRYFLLVSLSYPTAVSLRRVAMRQELSDFLRCEYAAGGCKSLKAMVLVVQ